MMTQTFRLHALGQDAAARRRFNLATSGVGSFPLRELPFDCATLEINGDNSYGYRAAEAGHRRAQYGVDPDCVVTAAGTSMANYLAMAALLEAGDEVLIEHPAYGLLVDAARYIGADVKRFARREENGYAVDPAEVRRAVTPKTRLIVVTNLHNPSSVLTPEAVLREVADIARSVGARVLVDEVYLDAVYENTPRTAFHLGPEVRGHQQPDQSLRPERTALRMDSGRARTWRAPCGSSTICSPPRPCTPASC